MSEAGLFFFMNELPFFFVFNAELVCEDIVHAVLGRRRAV